MRAIVLSMVVLALQPGAAAADCRERISLSPPSDVESVDGIGRAEIRSNDSHQTFIADVAVDVPEGTPLFVFANGEPAGTITAAPGIATLELSNANGDRLPAGVDSVCSIGPVSITNADGTTLLTGSF